MENITQREAQFFDTYWQKKETRQIDGKLEIPEVPNLEGARILICSCGSGIEPVLAANAGAQVFAFDISFVAVARALAVAKANNINLSAAVMDFSALSFPDNFFDVIYGSSVLHHVDCEKAGRELLACLKPNGVAFFWENSDRNPVLRYARRILFGSPDGYQRQRLLFLRRRGTTDEYPLTEDEIKVLSNIFSGNLKRITPHFVFFQLFGRLISEKRAMKKRMKNLDQFMARLFPGIVPYSFSQGIWLQKKAKQF